MSKETPGAAVSTPPATESAQNDLQAALDAALADRCLLEALSSTIDLDDVLELLGREIESTGEFDGYLICLVDDRGRDLVCERIRLPAEFKTIERTYHHFRFPVDHVDVNTVAFRERKRTVVTRDHLEGFSPDTPSRLDRWGIVSMLSLPLMDDGEPFGCVTAFRRDGGIDEASADRLEQRLRFFMRPLHNAAAHRELKSREDNIQSAAEAQKRLLHFITQVNSLSSTDQIYQLISEEFLRRFPFDMVAILTGEGDRIVVRKLTVLDPEFEPRAEVLREFYSRESHRMSLEDGGTPAAYLQNTHLFFPDAMQLMEMPLSEIDRNGLTLMETPRSVFLVPIRRKQKPIGVLWLVSLREPVEISDADREFVDLLCSFIGTAMANAELYSVVEQQNREIEELNGHLQQKIEELRELASKDRLTGLANFGAFETELSRRMNEYQRDSKRNGLSLAIIDVDHFKQFNDTYGHQAGNMVLQEVARRLGRLARKMDIPCRYGGEEFVVILPKCELEGAEIFAERIRESIADVPFYTEGEQVQVTVSVGCACYRPGEDPESFLQRADRALYRAKEQGRNRVEVAP